MVIIRRIINIYFMRIFYLKFLLKRINSHLQVINRIIQRSCHPALDAGTPEKRLLIFPKNQHFSFIKMNCKAIAFRFIQCSLPPGI